MDQYQACLYLFETISYMLTIVEGEKKQAKLGDL